MFHLTLIGFCLLLGTFSTGKRMRNRGSKSEECGTTHDDKCWYSNGTVGGVRNGFSWVPALYWLLDLGLCHQNSRRNVPGKQHPQLAFQSILAMFLRWSSWLGEKNKPLDSPSPRIPHSLWPPLFNANRQQMFELFAQLCQSFQVFAAFCLVSPSIECLEKCLQHLSPAANVVLVANYSREERHNIPLGEPPAAINSLSRRIQQWLHLQIGLSLQFA